MIAKKKFDKTVLDKQNIEKEVDSAMNYLEQMDYIELDHHFDSRVINTAAALGAQLSLRKTAPMYLKLMFKMRRLKPVFMVVLCLINMISLVWFSGIFSGSASEQKPDEMAYVQAMESTYSLEQNDYDIKLIGQMQDVSQN